MSENRVVRKMHARAADVVNKVKTKLLTPRERKTSLDIDLLGIASNLNKKLRLR